MFKKFKDIEIGQTFYWRCREYIKTEEYPVCGSKYSNAEYKGGCTTFKDDDEVEYYVDKLLNIGRITFLDNDYRKGFKFGEISYIKFVDELKWVVDNLSRILYVIEWLEPDDILLKEIEDYYNVDN